jgi:hypothetical protein
MSETVIDLSIRKRRASEEPQLPKRLHSIKIPKMASMPDFPESSHLQEEEYEEVPEEVLSIITLPLI